MTFDEEQKLQSVAGGVKPAEQLLLADIHHDTTIRVPNFEKRTYIDRIKEKIPFAGTERQPFKTKVLEDGTEVVVDDQVKRYTDEELDEIFGFEQIKPTDPYSDIQSAPGESVVVPPDAPTNQKKKGVLTRFFDSIGLGADEDEIESDRDEYDPGDPKYRDITDQDDV